MAETVAPSPQQIALQRLLQADAEAQSSRLQARDQSSKTIADGEEAARRLIADARAAAEAEAVAARERILVDIETEAGRLRAQAQQDVDAMNQRAQEHLADATAFLVAWVTMEG